MSNSALFKRYIQMAEVLGQMFPDTLEVIVHDFKNLDKSIIFIVNGHLSQRKIGDPATELGIRRLLSEEEIPDVLVNYTNRTPQGNKMKSSSIAIRDDKGNMIGAFCLNFSVSYLEQFQSYIDHLIKGESLSIVGDNELFQPKSLQEEIQIEMQNYLMQHNLLLSQLSYKDKQQIVAYFYRHSLFQRKGAIAVIAKALKLTRQSVYNYLKSFK